MVQPNVERALRIAYEYGAIQGDHHRAWVIDQMVRALTGSDYAEWVRERKAGADGSETHYWDEGIAP